MTEAIAKRGAQLPAALRERLPREASTAPAAPKPVLRASAATPDGSSPIDVLVVDRRRCSTWPSPRGCSRRCPTQRASSCSATGPARRRQVGRGVRRAECRCDAQRTLAATRLAALTGTPGGGHPPPRPVGPPRCATARSGCAATTDSASTHRSRALRPQSARRRGRPPWPARNPLDLAAGRRPRGLRLCAAAAQRAVRCAPAKEFTRPAFARYRALGALRDAPRGVAALKAHGRTGLSRRTWRRPDAALAVVSRPAGRRTTSMLKLFNGASRHRAADLRRHARSRLPAHGRGRSASRQRGCRHTDRSR